MPLERRKKLKFAAATSVAFAGIAAVILSPIGETVASYADDSFGGGEFNAVDAEWHIESSTNGTHWEDRGPDSPATLTVSTAPISPAQAAYAPFSMRVKEGSRLSGGTVSMNAGTQINGSTVAGGYQMRAVAQTGSSCNADSFGAGSTFILGAASQYGTMLSAGQQTFALPAPQSFSEPGAARTVCLEFSLPDTAASDSLNGTAASVRWTFTASQS